MTVLSSDRILEEKNTSDATSITALTLTHRALSDVSCLKEFKNLEKLDLSFNNLTSLESLKSCVNLKWLSVANNNLQSLKGIECLSKLTVLNAGKNKLKSLDGVETLTSMKALILNDNELNVVSNLQQMEELNTLVLSRNPISSLPESLKTLKSITKLSLSKCKLSSIDSSLLSCLNLKELRLSHNEIMSIPDELKHLVKLQNLDIGNNLISNWSSIKVLSSLVNLKNLNLQGNPIAEKEKLLKKVKKLLPSLHIFNARPIDKLSVNGRDAKAKLHADDDEGETDQSKNVKNSGEAQYLNRSADKSLGNSQHSGQRKKTKQSVETGEEDGGETKNIPEKNMNKMPNPQQNNLKATPQEAKLKKPRNEAAKDPGSQANSIRAVKQGDKKSRKQLKKEDGSMIDSSEVSFTDIFASIPPEAFAEASEEKSSVKRILNTGGSVAKPSKKKKSNKVVKANATQFFQAEEIGLGGPCTWE